MLERSKLLSQYKSLRQEIYVLFFGRVVTNMGSMVWPMLTMIMSQKLGMNASTIAVVMVLSGVLLVPANILGGKLADNGKSDNTAAVIDAAKAAIASADSDAYEED